MTEKEAVYRIEKIIFNNLDNYCDNGEERQTVINTLEKMIAKIKSNED